MKKDYQTASKELFNALGGEANIEYFIHCMTRMRFHLKNWDLVNDEEIKKSNYATGINKNKSNGEYQIIIGVDVDKFYQIFCEVNGYENDGKNRKVLKGEATNFKISQSQEIANVKKKYHLKGFLGRGLAFISQVFAPIVIPLLGYGLLLSIWSLLTVDWYGTETSLAAQVHFFGELESILGILTNSFSLFITITLGYTVFKAMKCDPIYGIIIAVVLTAPGLINMGDVHPGEGQTIIGIYPGWQLFGSGTYPFKISYNGLIIPIILVLVFGTYLQRWTNKITNNTARMILSPLIIIGVSYLAGIFIMAPIGMLFTNYLSIGINWSSTNAIAKYIIIPIIGGLYGPLVITGLHHSLTPIILQGQAQYGATVVQGFITISNISQGIATIAFATLHHRVRQTKDLGISNGVSAIVGGITEPSLYTVNLKHLFPMIACSIGTFTGTLLLVGSNTYALQGASSIFGILMYQQQAPIATGVKTWAGGGYLWGTLSILASCIVTFGLTFVFGKMNYFWQRTKKIMLEEYNVDIDQLKTIKRKEWKLMMVAEREDKKTQKSLQKEQKIKLKNENLN